MSLTRAQILKGDYVYPTDFVRLKQTTHFTERLEERGIGIDCIPTLVRITKNNIHSGEAKGNRLTSVVVRIKYSSMRYMFICFNPKDGFLKTLWFRERRRDYGSGSVAEEDSRQTVRDTRVEGKI